MTIKGIELTAEEQKMLKDKGIRIDLGDLTQTEYSLRDTARICDLASAWVRTQLKQGKIAGTKKKIKNRAVWQVKAEEVDRIRREQAEKLLERAQNAGKGKKYTYRRPTEWAYHLTVKAIRSDKKLNKNQKETMLNAMNRYKSEWERAYQERLAKKEANKAEND